MLVKHRKCMSLPRKENDEKYMKVTSVRKCNRQKSNFLLNSIRLYMTCLRKYLRYENNAEYKSAFTVLLPYTECYYLLNKLIAID